MNQKKALIVAVVVVVVVLATVMGFMRRVDRKSAQPMDPGAGVAPGPGDDLSTSKAASTNSVADLLTPDSDPKGVIAARRSTLDSIDETTAALAAVARDIRLKTQSLYEDDPDLSRMASEARELESSVRSQLTSPAGLAVLREKLAVNDREIKLVRDEIRRAMAHTCPLCDGSAPTASGHEEGFDPGKAAAEHAARRKAEQASLQKRLADLKRKSVDLRTAAARAQNSGLKDDPELDVLIARARTLNARIMERVMADPDVAALVKRRDELVARKAELVELRDDPDAGEGHEAPQLSERRSNSQE